MICNPTIYIKKSLSIEGAYYAEKNSSSELLLKHINGGSRNIHGEYYLSDVIDLATAHGWHIKILNTK